MALLTSVAAGALNLTERRQRCGHVANPKRYDSLSLRVCMCVRGNMGVCMESTFKYMKHIIMYIEAYEIADYSRACVCQTGNVRVCVCASV